MNDINTSYHAIMLSTTNPEFAYLTDEQGILTIPKTLGEHKLSSCASFVVSMDRSVRTSVVVAIVNYREDDHDCVALQTLNSVYKFKLLGEYDAFNSNSAA